MVHGEGKCDLHHTPQKRSAAPQTSPFLHAQQGSPAPGTPCLPVSPDCTAVTSCLSCLAPRFQFMLIMLTLSLSSWDSSCLECILLSKSRPLNLSILENNWPLNIIVPLIFFICEHSKPLHLSPLLYCKSDLLLSSSVILVSSALIKF